MNVKIVKQSKEKKYGNFIHDFRNMGYTCKCCVLAAGFLVFIDKCCRNTLNFLKKYCKCHDKSKFVSDTCSQISLLASYVIFHS